MEELIKQRLKAVLEEKGCNPTQFAKIHHLNQKTVHNQINATTQVSASIILLLLDSFPDLSAEWLLRGKGDMMLKDNCESALCQEENEDIQSLRDKIISLEAENKVLRELLGLRNEINKEGIA